MGCKHELEQDEAHTLAGHAAMDVWPPPGSDKRPVADGDGDGPQPKRRALADGYAVELSDAAHAAADAGTSSTSSGSNDLAGALHRAQEAEANMEFLNSIMTRVIEHLTQSVAAMRTAGIFARSAANAFETETHNLQSYLDQIQALYSGQAPARSVILHPGV